jgi:hypothetical protein
MYSGLTLLKFVELVDAAKMWPDGYHVKAVGNRLAATVFFSTLGSTYVRFENGYVHPLYDLEAWSFLDNPERSVYQAQKYLGLSRMPT